MLRGRCRQARGYISTSPISICQCLQVSTWLLPMTGRPTASWFLLPTWQSLLGPGQPRPVLVPIHVQHSEPGRQAHLETYVATGKARGHCQPHSIAVLRKEITTDPTALLPMLFAGDSQGFPCQLGSHTAQLFLHQMARPTPSGCARPRETRL